MSQECTICGKTDGVLIGWKDEGDTPHFTHGTCLKGIGRNESGRRNPNSYRLGKISEDGTIQGIASGSREHCMEVMQRRVSEKREKGIHPDGHVIVDRALAGFPDGWT